MGHSRKEEARGNASRPPSTEKGRQAINGRKCSRCFRLKEKQPALKSEISLCQRLFGVFTLWYCVDHRALSWDCSHRAMASPVGPGLNSKFSPPKPKKTMNSTQYPISFSTTPYIQWFRSSVMFRFH